MWRAFGHPLSLILNWYSYCSFYQVSKLFRCGIKASGWESRFVKKGDISVNNRDLISWTLTFKFQRISSWLNPARILSYQHQSIDSSQSWSLEESCWWQVLQHPNSRSGISHWRLLGKPPLSVAGWFCLENRSRLVFGRRPRALGVLYTFQLWSSNVERPSYLQWGCCL